MMKYILLLSAILSFWGCGNNACDKHSCLNGGVCDGDTCVCPTGYGDNDCFLKKAPVKIRITQIDVKKFPSKNGSSNWDTNPGAAPDIFPKIWITSNQVLWNGVNQTVNDAIYTNTYEFIISPALEVSDLSSNYSCYLFDNEGGSLFTQMGGSQGKIYNQSSEFPATLTIGSSSTYTFLLHLEYVF